MQWTKKNVGRVMLVVYIVASLVYIGYSLWLNFKIQYTEQVFQSGQTYVIERLIVQAEDPNCQPFSVYTADKEVQLINLACTTNIQDEIQDNTTVSQ